MIELPGSAPAPTFESPLEMLRACHGRIMAQCDTLQKLLQHLPVHGCDAQARQAAQAILRYFDTAAQYHHQDEEMDLFPLLLASPSTEAHEVVLRLLGEHHEMGTAWLRLRSRLQDIAEGHAALLEESVAATFSTAYERHITFENAHLLPLAARLLSPQQLHDLGRKMALRRGVSLTPA
jgi:hemerythrin-like domain-containing protein